MIAGTSMTSSMNCTWSTSTFFLRVFNSLRVVAVTNVDQIVTSPLVVVTSRRADLVLVSHVPHDETRALVSCLTLMFRTVPVSVRFERWELGAFLHLASLRS